MDIQALLQYLPSVRDATQALFFIVVGTVTVLTYAKAKRTLLQPIRTEIFKEQVKAFAELLGFFIGKDETDLRSTFAMDKLLRANACLMLDSYARLFFEAETNPDKRPYSLAECPTAIMSDKYLQVADEYVQPPPPLKSPSPDPSVKAALWAKYDHGRLCIPRELSDAEKRFQHMLDSPLLPTRCVELGEEFLATVMENIMLVWRLLWVAAQELPEKYPNRESLQKASLGWLQVRFAEEFVHLEPRARAITTFLRKYYVTDNLLNP